MKNSEFYTVIKNDGGFAVDFGYYTVGLCGHLQTAVCDFEKKEKYISEQPVNPFSKKFGELKSKNCNFLFAKEGSAVHFACDNTTTFFHTACKANIMLKTENGRTAADGFVEIKGKIFEFASDDCTVILSNEYPNETRNPVISGFTGGEAFSFSCYNGIGELVLNNKKYFLSQTYEVSGAKGYGRREFSSADGSVFFAQPLFNDRIEISSPLGAAHQNRFICRADGFIMLSGKKLEFENAFGIFE